MKIKNSPTSLEQPISIGTNVEKFNSGEIALSNQQTPLVLAVDDHQDSLVIVNHVLETLGCLPIMTTKGEEVIYLAQKYQPDLILLDIVLPGIDGIKLVSQLRQDPALDQTKIVAVTGLALTEERSQILSAGFDDYVSKPYLLNDLETVICRHLQLVPSVYAGRR